MRASAGNREEVGSGNFRRQFLPILLFEGEMLVQSEKFIGFPVTGDSMTLMGDSQSLDDGDVIINPDEKNPLKDGKVYALSYYNLE